MKIVIALLSMMLLGAACAGPRRLAPVSATPDPSDTKCSACIRRSCLAAMNACRTNPDCQRLFMCVGADGRICGPSTPAAMIEIRRLLACLSAQCPECPNEGGADT